MHEVFLMACLITSVAFALSWLLREVPLRRAHAPDKAAPVAVPSRR